VPDQQPTAADWPARVSVVGAGLMGRRIAGVLASAGAEVRLADVRSDVLDEAVAEARQVAIDGAPSLARARPGSVEAVREVDDSADGADLVVEAVVEDVAVKNALFARLRCIAPEAVLATNSSVLPVTRIAAGVDRADLIVGMHWWNPPDLVPIVEVVQGELTDPDVVERVMSFLARAGKTPVWVRKDVAGFIGNRLQHALWREALHLVAAGVADAETVDLVVRNTIGLRLAQMGPLENADYVGLDLTAAIHQAVLPELDRSTDVSPLVRALVEDGRLGAKSGSGLLEWPPGRREQVRDDLAYHVRSGLRDRAAPSPASDTL
jgi:3-hydroxybutyryl-CoA dehydrogenase